MIELVNLRKEYDEIVAVRDVSLKIAEGEIFGLIGPNGAGKTTLIRMTCGLLNPTWGTVRVNGIDVHAEPERAQQYIGYLSDFFNLYDDLKVWEYLDYFAHAYKMNEAEIPARIDALIAEMGLEVKRDTLIRGLSRGMRQRLGIARAIIHRPKLVLLDEPASGLDPKARFELKQTLRKVRDGGATVVVSSHILPDLEDFCTSIGVMERGDMVRSGSLQAISMAEAPQRAIRVTWVGDGLSKMESVLGADARVSSLALEVRGGTFHFGGGDAALADLLQHAVTAGVAITSFSEVKQTVEELYMKISHNQVM
jgi:ABC-2 type transport system ATP-binding protein